MRIEIRRITSVNLDEVAMASYSLRDNEIVWRFMECDTPRPASLLSETNAYYSELNKSDQVAFAVYADDAYCGNVKLKHIAYGAAELSYYLLNTEMWGRGIGFEATRQVIDYGFDVLNLDLIYRYVNPNNVASWRISRKQKFAPIGISYINHEVERLEMTRTGWKSILKW